MALITLLVMMMLAVSPVLSSRMGEPCQDDYDCANDQQECIKRFEECETKACFCKPDYRGRFATSCSKVLDLTDRCDDRGDWLRCPDQSDCDHELDRCIPWIRAGSSCTTTTGSIRCVSNAYCTSNICTCSSYLKMENGLCVQPDFGEVCTTHCGSNYDCKGISLTCQCFNSTYTQLTYKEEGEDVTKCVHAQATKGVAVGGACRIGDTTNFGRICGSGLTCSKCLAEDAPTCITPTGGADGVKAGFFILIAALLLTKLM